jgi:hypothetical protein
MIGEPVEREAKVLVRLFRILPLLHRHCI